MTPKDKYVYYIYEFEYSVEGDKILDERYCKKYSKCAAELLIMRIDRLSTII